LRAPRARIPTATDNAEQRTASSINVPGGDNAHGKEMKRSRQTIAATTPNTIAAQVRAAIAILGAGFIPEPR